MQLFVHLPVYCCVKERNETSEDIDRSKEGGVFQGVDVEDKSIYMSFYFFFFFGQFSYKILQNHSNYLFNKYLSKLKIIFI